MQNKTSVPHGYCHCGCGQKTPLAVQTSKRRGWVKGEPLKYAASGHEKRRPDEARFWEKVRKDGCWQWTGGITPNGYGQFWANGKQGSAHRFAYQLLVGAIPEGQQIDHLCKNRACVNPDHLEAVTPKENVRRGLSGPKTHCIHGHEYTPENTYWRPSGGRRCLRCRAEGRS